VLVLAAIAVVLVVLAAALFLLTRRRAQLPPSIYGRAETTEAPLTRAAPAPPPNVVTVFGAAGTFGDVANTRNRPTTVAVDGWSFEPGASAFFTGATTNGRVLIGTVPQSDNQAVATGTTMSIGVLDPAAQGAEAFTTLRVPTSGGAESTTIVGSDVGGADVSDLCAVRTHDGPRVLAISSVPYKFWDLGLGEFPAVVSFLDDARRSGAAAISIDRARTRIPEALRDTGAGRQAVPVGAGDGDGFPSTPGLTECDTLPGGDVAVTQYFPPAGRSSGGVVVLSPDGEILAFHQVDDLALSADLSVPTDRGTVTVPKGTSVTMSPREVRADPSRTDPKDQRFLVVYDTGATVAAAPGGTAPGGDGRVRMPQLFQELRYDAERHTINPTSPPFVMRDEKPINRPATDLVFAYTSAYAPDGTLFLTRAHAGSLLSATTAVFRPGALSGRSSSPTPLAAQVTADALLTAFDGDAIPSPGGGRDFGATFSINFDPINQTLIQVSAGNAALRSIRWNGWDGPDPASSADASLCQVDLGGQALNAANPDVRFQARQGVIDPAGHALYLSYQGLPSGEAKHNVRLPQYLFGVNLDRLASCA
jgi:hypothetical protein